MGKLWVGTEAGVNIFFLKIVVYFIFRGSQILFKNFEEKWIYDFDKNHFISSVKEMIW